MMPAKPSISLFGRISCCNLQQLGKRKLKLPSSFPSDPDKWLLYSIVRDDDSQSSFELQLDITFDDVLFPRSKNAELSSGIKADATGPEEFIITSHYKPTNQLSTHLYTLTRCRTPPVNTYALA